MVTKIFGTQGTVSEAQWANMMSLATQKYTRRDPVNALLNATNIQIPPFFTVGAGVGVEETATTTVPLPSGAISGRWYLLVLRRTWGLTPTVRHEWLLSNGEGGTTPEGWPLELPSTRQKRPGVVDDEPVLWYYHQEVSASRRIVDASNLAGGTIVTNAGMWDANEQGFQRGVVSSKNTVDIYSRSPVNLKHPMINSSRELRTLVTAAAYMHGGQSVVFSELVSEQLTGIVIVWQIFDQTTQVPASSGIVEQFISKASVLDLPGCGHFTFVPTWRSDGGPADLALKYVYVHDHKIVGHAMNSVGGAKSHVLTKVYGV
jgi:hypothetical protein